MTTDTDFNKQLSKVERELCLLQYSASLTPDDWRNILNKSLDLKASASELVRMAAEIQSRMIGD